MRETKLKYNTKNKDRSKRGERGEREGDREWGLNRRGKKRDQSLRLAQGRSLQQKTHTHAHKKKIIHARPATHTQRRKERQRRNVIHRRAFRRAVNPNRRRAVADERRGKKGRIRRLLGH
uniref:Uncharacterized protein n=1 Tax=Rhipicephalus zambeziensis TaxID=60191 RepID=A0A224Y6W4_9ACAR